MTRPTQMKTRRRGVTTLVTTHFLDFAEQMQREPAVSDLGFLQAEIDAEQGATFRFIPGVASTSLAVGTARRLGVTFDRLERNLENRNSSTGDGHSDQVEDLAPGNHQE